MQTEIQFDWRKSLQDHPVIGRLVGKENSGTLIRVAVALLIWYVGAFVVCWHSGCLTIPGPDYGLLEDVFMACIFPMVLLATHLALRMFERSNHLLRFLPKQVNVDDSVKFEKLHIQHIRHVENILALRTPQSRSWYAWFMITCVFIIYVMQFHVPYYHRPDIAVWAILPRDFPGVFVFAIFWALFYWGIVIANILWCILVASWGVFSAYNQAARDKHLDVTPMSSESTNCFSELGRFSFDVAGVVGSGVILVIAWTICYGVNAAQIIGVNGYLLLLAATFLVPLFSVHREMVKSKQKQLNVVGDMYAKAYAQLKQQPQNDLTGEDVRATIQHLAEIDVVCRRIEEIPVWPIDTRTYRRFFSLLIVPLVIIVIQVVTENAITTALGLGH